jgi:L-arabinonolactonase
VRITQAELLVDAQARLGECAIWCEQAQAFYWTDIEASIISRWREGQPIDTWRLPDRVGSFALCQQPDQLLLGLAGGIALYNLATGAMTPVIPVEADQPTTRINDGRCDAQGRFVFGMFNGARGAQPIGHFYRVHADLRVETLPLPPAAVANSICFGPDGKRLYYTDTPTRQILCCDYQADGQIGPAQVFACLSEADGYPDGSTVDADGGLWNARWQGRCVVRYDGTGVITDRVEIAASQATCPAFGGPALDRLFITSARIGLSGEALAQEPLAGGIFTATPAGRRGLTERRFMTALRA